MLVNSSSLGLLSFGAPYVVGGGPPTAAQIQALAIASRPGTVMTAQAPSTTSVQPHIQLTAYDSGIPGDGHVYTGDLGTGGSGDTPLLPDIITKASTSSKTMMILAGVGVIGAAIYLGSKRLGKSKSAAMAGYSRHRKHRRSRSHR